MTAIRRRSALVTSIIAVTLVSCSTGGTESPSLSLSSSAASSADIPWANVWSSSQGIDLFSRGAELTRATLEGGYLAQARGDDRSFPGYAEAIGPQQYKYGDPRRGAKNYGYAAEGTQPRAPGVTAIYYRLVALEVTSTRVLGTVCGYGLSPKVSDAAKYLSNAFSVALSKPAGMSGGSAGVIDTGSNSRDRPGKVPTWNVFAPWRVVQIQFAQPDEVPASCPIWWKSVFPDAVKDVGTNQMTRPSGGPIAPDVAQFPKWISPSNAQ